MDQNCNIDCTRPGKRRVTVQGFSRVLPQARLRREVFQDLALVRQKTE